MITVELCSRNGALVGFAVEGHSGFAESGRDIVCASVSSCALMVANTVTDVLCLPADVDMSDGFLRVVIHGSAEKAKGLLEGFRLHMTELAKEYPQYVLCKSTTL